MRHRGFTQNLWMSTDKETQLPAMKAKRGMPKNPSRVEAGWAGAPPGYWPDDEVKTFLIGHTTYSRNLLHLRLSMR